MEHKIEIAQIDDIAQAIGRLKGFAALQTAMVGFLEDNILPADTWWYINGLLEFLVDDLDTKFEPINCPSETDTKSNHSKTTHNKETRMDHTTVDLLRAIDFLLRQARTGKRWIFEEGSEIHIALTEANAQARIALGIDTPRLTHKEEIAA